MLRARVRVHNPLSMDRGVTCRIVELPITELSNYLIAEQSNCRIVKLTNYSLQLFFILLISILQPLINNTVIIIKNTGPEA